MDKQFAESQEDILADIRDLLVGVYIQNMRIYDVLTLQTSLINHTAATKIEELINLHETGGILCPEPLLSPNE
jgi:hypothetical protein